MFTASGDPAEFALKLTDELRKASRVLMAEELARVVRKSFLITTQAKRNLSSRSGIGGVLSAT